MKIELIKYNDDGIVTYWVKVDESLAHIYSMPFFDYESAEIYFDKLVKNYTGKQSNPTILKSVTL